METLKKLSRIFAAGLLMTAFAVNFNACSEQSPVGPAQNKSAAKFSKRGGGSAVLVAEAMVEPGKDVELALTGEGLISATFKLKKVEVSKPTLIRLEKLGQTENAYRLSPAGLQVPMGIDIELEFSDDRIIPAGASAEDLKVFRMVDGSPQQLETKVKANDFKYKDFQAEIKAKAYETGEFALGAPIHGKFTPANGFNFLSLGNGIWQLGDELQVRGWITQEKGGELELKHTWENENGEDVKVEVSLKVQKESINKDAEFILTFDEEYFMGDMDVVLHPHGVVFSKPALLNIKAEGLDLSGWDKNALGLYYDNDESGSWDAMTYKKFKVDTEKGKIELKDGQLDHFSRYAIGAEL